MAAETIWSRLMAGKLPSMDFNTDVTINQDSVMRTGTILFIVVVLMIISYFAIRKQFVR